MHKLVLGSTSPYRGALLAKLGIAFTTDAPQIDETVLEGESAEQLVARLAEAKARDVGARHTESLIIGSDQVACMDGQILGKPGNRGNAVEQLVAAAGRTVVFHTGLCLYNPSRDRARTIVEPFSVHFRRLDRAQIERYVDREEPFNCAGSFKSEGYGITLFRRLEGADPNSLVGLPLIRLVDMLNEEGIALP